MLVEHEHDVHTFVFCIRAEAVPVHPWREAGECTARERVGELANQGSTNSTRRAHM